MGNTYRPWPHITAYYLSTALNSLSLDSKIESGSVFQKHPELIFWLVFRLDYAAIAAGIAGQIRLDRVSFRAVMRTAAVIETDKAPNPGPNLAGAAMCPQIPNLVFYGPLTSLNGAIVLIGHFPVISI